MKKIAFGIVALATLAACSEEPLPREQAPDIEAGSAIAAEKCAGCHGADGHGLETDIPNIAAQPVEYLVGALNAYRDGTRQHAALHDITANMSETDILNIAAYYASRPALERGPEPAPPVADVTYVEGEAIAAICTDCHGPGGYSESPGVPSLAAQQPAYLIVSTLEYVHGTRDNPEKERMLEGLRQIDIEKMSFYFASQSPPRRPAPEFGDPSRGEALSAACGECHGARGISHDPLVPSLAGQEPHYLVDAIKAYRDRDRHHDIMMTDRNDAAIEDIAAFYAVQNARAAVSDASETVELAAKCDRCHAPAAWPRSLAVPSLRGQNRDYLVKAMKAYRDESRGSSMMHKMSSEYSDRMIEALATHYSTQSGE